MIQSKEQSKKINEDYIIKRCHDLLQSTGITEPPVDPKILASFCGINKIAEEDIEEAGMLIPIKKDDFKILLRKHDSKKRKRFSCCHEICHTFMPDFELKPQKRVDKETGYYGKDNNIEYLCDFGASELLMPSFLFNDKFKQSGFSIKTLLELSDEFVTSLEATAIKMVKMNPSKYALVIWDQTHKPSEMELVTGQTLPGFESGRPKKKLRVKMGFGFGGKHIPTHKSLVEDNNIVFDAYSNNVKKKGKGSINFGYFSVNCTIHALPMTSIDRVLTLLEKKKIV